MKKFILMFTCIMSSIASAATPTPMNLVEKAAHKLAALVAKAQVDASFGTDVSEVIITSRQAGTQIDLNSPSADPKSNNTLSLQYDSGGVYQSFAASFKSKSASSPLFKVADASKLLDLGAEAVVDHLNESADMPVVATQAQSVQIAIEGNTGVHMRIQLKDGRTYSVMMDLSGKVISKGF